MENKRAIFYPAFLAGCLLLLLQTPPMRVLAQADTTAARILRISGFGPELTITSPPVFRIDRDTSSTFLITPPPTPSLAQVQAAAFNLSYDSFQTRLSHDTRPYIFWIRFSARNNSDSALPIAIYTGSLDYVDCWWVPAGQPITSQPIIPGQPDTREHPVTPSQPDTLVIPGEPVTHLSGGVLHPPIADSSLIARQYHILSLRLSPHQSGQLFLALRQKSSVYGFDGIQLYTPDALGSAFAKDYQEGHPLLIFQWLFQGFLLCQILYMLFQWVIIRRKEYGYYLAYMTVIALYFLSKFESDLGLNLLFTRHPLLKIYLSKTMLILPYFLYFRFVRYFLEIPQHYPALNKWIIRIEYFLLIYAAADLGYILLTFDQSVQTYVFTVILLLVFVTAASFILYLFRHRQALIYYVLTGSLFVAIGNILGQVFTYFQDYRHLNIFPNILLFPQAGVLLEILCFTAGLSYKSHMWEKEKIRSQERLIDQLKANELLQSRMQHIRNKIAQDLHDDIGSTLSSISILSDLAIKDKSSSLAFETMNEIKDSSLLLMEKMDDIVWSINPRNDSLENLLIRVRHFATTLFEAKDIDYRIDIQKNIHEVRLPMDYRQHIYLILKEAINNLVKYAHASEAIIEVGFDHQHLELCVRDNGRGFDPSGPSTGNGISGMQRRASLMDARINIRSAPDAGTAIRLQVDLA